MLDILTPQFFLLAATSVALLIILGMLVGLHRASLRQVHQLQQQLETRQSSVQSQNLLYALSILRDQDFRTAMMVLRSRLKGTSPETWGTDVHHVLLVCSTYNLVGLLLKNDLIPYRLFLQHWGSSVIDAWEILSEFIRRRQLRNPDYCADFQWLFEQSRHAEHSEAASTEIPVQVAEGEQPNVVGL